MLITKDKKTKDMNTIDEENKKQKQDRLRERKGQTFDFDNRIAMSNFSN